MKNKRGFTLIELMLVLALIGIMIPIIFSPLIFSLKNFHIQNEESNVISNARMTMDYLTREIRKADANAVEVIDGNLIVNSKTYNIGNGTLYKDGRKVIEGIDEITIWRDGRKITIEIKIEDYELSSDINLRE